MPSQSAEVLPRCHNTLSFRIIVATLRAIQQYYFYTPWKIWILRRSVAINPLYLLVLAGLGDTWQIETEKFVSYSRSAVFQRRSVTMS